jgi:hypothetical protein
MNSDDKLVLLFLGVPLAGLLYCALGITAMVYFSSIREHALISGLVFFLIPFSTAATIWIKASAKAYRK